MCNTIQIQKPCLVASYSSLNRGKIAPYIDVQITNIISQDNPVMVQVKALLDTGSSCTLIPISVLTSIGAKPTRLNRTKVRGINETRYTPNYPVKIYFCNSQHKIVAKGWDRKWNLLETKHLIIGRDLLNRYGVLFDGFGLVSQEQLNYHVWEQSR